MIVNNNVVPASAMNAELHTVDTEQLAALIRSKSEARIPVTPSDLVEETGCAAEQLSALLAGSGIPSFTGSAGTYYYDGSVLSEGFVRSAVLAKEGNIANTVRTLVRHNAQTYPRATAFGEFLAAPFGYTEEQVSAAFNELKSMPGYGSITEYVSRKGRRYLYFADCLKPDLAEKLIEDSEDPQLWM